MNKILSKYRSAFLSFGFLVVFASSNAFGEATAVIGSKSAIKTASKPATETQAAKIAVTDFSSAQLAIEQCAEDAMLTAKIPAGNPPGSLYQNTAVENVSKKKNCVQKNIDAIESLRDGKDCDSACKKKANRMIRRAYQNNDMTNLDSEDVTNECDSIYDKESDDIKECRKMDQKVARSCAKSENEDGMAFIDNETLEQASPFLQSINGANAMLGMYTAMKDKPGCRLSKADFKEKEADLNTQKKEIEDKIKENIKESEDAQTEYSDKLKSWAEAEGKIADRLNDMPQEKEDNLHKLDNEKLKAKMQADSKYTSILDQMSEVRKKYNDMVLAKSVALSENSDFAIHDRCAIVATGGDPAKQNNANAKPTAAVQASFAGAFAQGKVLSTNIQKRYDACVKTESLKQKRIEGTFITELASAKARLVSLDSALGQVNEEKRLAEQEVSYQMQNIEKQMAGEAKKLAAEYQRIQTDKTNAQSLLKQKLERLSTETKTKQQELAVLMMKLSAYSGKSAPTSGNSDKSIKEMMGQCGADFIQMIAEFKRQCCNGNYSGSGSSVCKSSYKDFEAELPKRTEAEKTAAKAQRQKNAKDAEASK